MPCFVMIRHVNSELTNKYWIECYNSIRTFYKDAHILIIDNKSNYDFITEIETVGTTVIQSEFVGRGELLGYYYYYKSGITDPAVILQDSMFIKEYIDFGSSPMLLWNFPVENDDRDNYNNDEILYLLRKLENSGDLITIYNNRPTWKGCFCSCAVIDYKTLQQLDIKYGLFNLVNTIITPANAQAFERVFPIVLHAHDPTIINRPLLGNIFNYINSTPGYCWFFTYNDYINNPKVHNKIIKVWSRRI